LFVKKIKMKLQEIVYSQGFGVRRVCLGLIQQGQVMVYRRGIATICLHPEEEFDEEGLVLRVQGMDWPYCAKAYLMLHKPAGTECSQRPNVYPSIYTLLPQPLRQRPNKGKLNGVQAVGRLDQDTTGLLLLSDDGQFIHRMSSPKKQVAKVYQVTTKHKVTAAQIERLLAGVVLHDEPQLVRAAACIQTGERQLELTLTQGKYHQVKRMLAAVGNRVEALHRSHIGDLALPLDLLPGQWRCLKAQELSLL